MSQYFEFNKDEDFIDRSWYLNVKDKQRLHIQNNCEHITWAKKCSCCNKILDSDALERQRNTFQPDIKIELGESENGIIDMYESNNSKPKVGPERDTTGDDNQQSNQPKQGN